MFAQDVDYIRNPRTGLFDAVRSENWLKKHTITDTVFYTIKNKAITTEDIHEFRTTGKDTNYTVFLNTHDLNGTHVKSQFTKQKNRIIVHPERNCYLDALIVNLNLGPINASNTTGFVNTPFQVSFAYKVPFNQINTQILPYAVEQNLIITPDTTGSISGANTSADFVSDGIHTIYFSGFSPTKGSSVDSFIPTNNYVSTYHFSKIGKYTYKYTMEDYKILPLTAIQSPPTFENASTNTTGDTVSVSFSKAMEASPSSTGLTFNPSRVILSITRNSVISNTFDIVVGTPFSPSDIISISYDPGTITANDRSVLASFSSQPCANNTTP
jgi:hypothetical protein